MKKHRLENYYKGDESWHDFVSCFLKTWDSCQFKKELTEQLGGYEDVAIVIYASAQDNSKKWIHQPIPALDGLSPHDCVSDENLLRRLRTMLMRMPR